MGMEIDAAACATALVRSGGEVCCVCVCVRHGVTCFVDHPHLPSPSTVTRLLCSPPSSLATTSPRLAPPRSDWLKLASSFSPSSRSSCPSPLTAHDDDHPHLHLPRLNLGPRTHCSRSLHQPHTTCDTNLPLSFSSSIPTIHLSFDPPTLTTHA